MWGGNFLPTFKLYYMKRNSLFIILVCLLHSSVFAQMRGTVLNAKQKPIKGLKIWRKNTTESIKTNDKGLFVFGQMSPTDTLIIPFSKKENAIIAVDQLKEITVTLNKKNYSVTSGSETKNYNYVKVLRSNLSSNILTHEQIEMMSANSLYDIFRSSVPGVTVSEGTSGQQIIIRGGNSFESGLEPLFIIDGAQYESSADADSRIVVNEIQKIEILKDGGQYGIKGANGVIIISTIGH